MLMFSNMASRFSVLASECFLNRSKHKSIDEVNVISGAEICSKSEG